jgi:hypothetical protein
MDVCVVRGVWCQNAHSHSAYDLQCDFIHALPFVDPRSRSDILQSNSINQGFHEQTKFLYENTRSSSMEAVSQVALLYFMTSASS